MKLAAGERSILAYFPTRSKAQEAAAALKDLGIPGVSLDQVSRYGATDDAQINNPANNAETLTGLTLFSEGKGALDDSERTLLGADPSVSGYVSEGYGAAGGKPFLVTAVTKEKLLDRAVQIVREHGGEV
ncbi:MAG: hypothetical protein BWY80_00138 [Firmicutes bacterium ADurb.Bin456]|nr:MAG: hypothetical protein BWY80_00138 [Firmicutes bacterium ADurb.Bin456]